MSRQRHEPSPVTGAAEVEGASPDFQPWLDRWRLVPDGPPARTRTGRFLPVTHLGQPAMLKVVTEREERDGSRVMAWWEGWGAAPVLALDDDAVLLARALGGASLKSMAQAGRDEEATTVLCQVAVRLHLKDPGDRPATVVPLEAWFAELWPVARSHGGIYRSGAEAAEELLAQPGAKVVLHGDLHHDNVLDFGAQEDAGVEATNERWLAIDPKGLYGERTFDFVNLLRNPDAELALAPGRFQAQVGLIAREGSLDARRLLRWTLAFTALSAAWILNDGADPALDIAVARLAQSQLAG